MTILERPAGVGLIALCVLAGMGGAQAQSESCRLFPGQPGFWTARAHVAVSQAGDLSARRDLAFTPCPVAPTRPAGEWSA